MPDKINININKKEGQIIVINILIFDKKKYRIWKKAGILDPGKFEKGKNKNIPLSKGKKWKMQKKKIKQNKKI